MHRCGSRNIVYMNVFDAETRTLLLAFAWLAKQKWLVSFALKVATGSPCNLFVSSSNQHQGASFEPIFVTIGCILVESCFCCCSFLQFLERKKSDEHHTQEPTRLRSQHNNCPIFEGVSRRVFRACFRNNWIYIGEVILRKVARYMPKTTESDLLHNYNG